MRSRLYNFTNRMSLACGMIPIKQIESLHPSLRFRILSGDDDVQVIRIEQLARS